MGISPYDIVSKMSKILLDGYGITLKAVRGETMHCPSDREDDVSFSEIVIETNKGDFIIVGCSNCGVLSFKHSEDPI